jgi:hypothetical protein
MAIAVCEQNTLPSLLPLTLSASGIPFNAKQDQPILMSGYAQYFLSILRILRLNFCQEDVLRLIKTGFTDMKSKEIMDMENYARENGIHRSRWLKPFHIPEKDGKKEKVQALEELRQNVSPTIVTMVNSLETYDSWEAICGAGRIIPAFPGAGGGFDGNVLDAALTPRLIQPTTFGKTDGRERELARVLRRAGRVCMRVCAADRRDEQQRRQ